MNIKVVINRLSRTLTKAPANTGQRGGLCQPFLLSMEPRRSVRWSPKLRPTRPSKPGRLRLFHPGGSLPIVSLNAPTALPIKSDLTQKSHAQNSARCQGSGKGGQRWGQRGHLEQGLHPLPGALKPSPAGLRAGFCPPNRAKPAGRAAVAPGIGFVAKHRARDAPLALGQCPGKVGRAFPHHTPSPSPGNQEGT